MCLYGATALSEQELLAILIGTGSENKTAIDLAGDMVRFHPTGISYLADCAPEELTAFNGIGRAKACQIIAGFELGKRLATKPKDIKYKANSPSLIADLFMEKMRYYKKEHFDTVMLNTKSEIISIENSSIGDLNSSIINPREIFSKAVKISASAVVFVHNHPSGNPVPSNEDIEVTKRLIKAGEILGIKVLDHIIVGDGTFVSLKAENLI